MLLVSRLRYEHDPPERSELSWASLAAGFHFLRDTRILLAAMLLDTFAVLLGGATALMPVYAKDILHGGPRELGLAARRAVGRRRHRGLRPGAPAAVEERRPRAARRRWPATAW